MTSSIRLYDPVGAEITIPVPGTNATEIAQSAREIQKSYGREGYTPFLTPPPGGLRFPLSNADDFDWALIGARPFHVTLENTKRAAVMFRGQTYIRREPPVTERMKERIIKYTRGAGRTDAKEAVEGEEGSRERYVTLILFKGGGRKLDAYALPAGAASQQKPTDATSAAELTPPARAEDSPTTAGVSRSRIPALAREDAPKLISYIRTVGRSEIPEEATLEYKGEVENLKAFVRKHWQRLPGDFGLTKQIALAIEAQAQTRFDPDMLKNEPSGPS